MFDLDRLGKTELLQEEVISWGGKKCAKRGRDGRCRKRKWKSRVSI